MRFSGRLGLDHATNELSLLARRLAASGQAVLNLSESNPTRCGLTPGGIVEALSDPANVRYDPEPRGLPGARRCLAERYRGSPNEYFLTASTSESYSWLFKLLCDPGDSILVPQPGYPLFEHLAGLESVKVVPYRLEYSHPAGWAIDAGQLAALLDGERVKAIVVISPNNPTGSYVTGAERDMVVRLCSSRGVALIADEVFHPYLLESSSSPLRIGGEEGCLCFSLDGLSKLTGTPQLKLGWLRVSGPAQELREAMERLEIIADSYLSASTPAMNALPRMLAASDAFVEGLRARLFANLAQAREVFGGPLSPYRVLRCDGGWTVLVEYPRYQGEEEMALGLLRDSRVSVQPGYFFDMERDGCLALSLILEPSEFRRGAVLVRRYIDSLSR
jgi:aspartate/methionine/tyrosine aminotransferase